MLARFWATPNKTCRFTADECRDLHAFLPASVGDHGNLRMGKPTWGALADSVPSLAPTTGYDTSMNDVKFSIKSKTCWYWANDGNCVNTAETCKYLHEHTANGVAPKPTAWRKRDFNWQRNRDEQGTEDYEGESVLEEAVTAWQNETESIMAPEDATSPWGAPGDRYKPPHVKAMEEKARIEALGW